MHPPLPATILEVVSTVYGLPIAEITGRDSVHNRVNARRCAMHYMATVGGMSNGDIAKVFKRSMNYASAIRRRYDEVRKMDKWEDARIAAVGEALTGREGVAA